MFDTIGKKLCQARQQRGLTVEEAAHATKLRPDQVQALEAGDFSRFASNAYARGFLQIYGRFLKVDVSADASALDTSHHVNIDDYQYLTNTTEPRSEPWRDTPDLRKRRQPSIMPWLAAFGVALVVLFLFSAYINWQRITGETAQQKEIVVPDAPQPVVAPVAQAPEPPLPAIAEAPPKPVAISDRDFLAAAPPPVATAPPAPDTDVVTATPVQINEIEIKAARKTWITIRRDDPKSVPVFEDYLYPSARSLKLKGTRFIIEVRDPESVQIIKNGTPMAFQEPDVTIQ